MTFLGDTGYYGDVVAVFVPEFCPYSFRMGAFREARVGDVIARVERERKTP